MCPRSGVHVQVHALTSDAPSTVRPLVRDPRVLIGWPLIGWPLPLGFGLDGRLYWHGVGGFAVCLIHHHHHALTSDKEIWFTGPRSKSFLDNLRTLVSFLISASFGCVAFRVLGALNGVLTLEIEPSGRGGACARIPLERKCIVPPKDSGGASQCGCGRPYSGCGHVDITQGL